MRREILSEYWLGDIVYLRTAKEKRKGMVSQVIVRPGGVVYDVTWGWGDSAWHYAIELSSEYVQEFDA